MYPSPEIDTLFYRHKLCFNETFLKRVFQPIPQEVAFSVPVSNGELRTFRSPPAVDIVCILCSLTRGLNYAKS